MRPVRQAASSRRVYPEPVEGWYDFAVNAPSVFRRHPLLLEFFLVGALVIAGHYVATRADLYYTFAATDVAMHFLGGLLVGLAALLAFFTSGTVRLPRRDGRVVAFVALASVLAVGLAWEVYELWFGLSDPVLDRMDTLGDIAMDLLGGVAALAYFRLTVVADETHA